MNNTPAPQPPPLPARPKAKHRGFLDADNVRAVSFYVITLCVIGSVVACILAIWDFANKDTLWRAVATCVVIAGGCALFSVVNAIFGTRTND
jgi:hypothetical protein